MLKRRRENFHGAVPVPLEERVALGMGRHDGKLHILLAGTAGHGHTSCRVAGQLSDVAAALSPLLNPGGMEPVQQEGVPVSVGEGHCHAGATVS